MTELSPTVDVGALGIVPPLATRLGPPRLGERLIQRDRLMWRLGASVAVHVVHAPAGYGKSTSLAQFAGTDMREVAWLTLDERDDDPVTFVADLIFALLGADDSAADLLEHLAARPAGVARFALPRLIRLLDELGRDTLIVLDDIHHAAGPESGEVLRALVDHVPAGSTLVLAGRARPALPLARLAASGHLAETDAGDLRMTVGEGTALLRRGGACPDDEEAELVVQRTEGWPAALYLVARAALAKEPRADAMSGLSEAELTDYFWDEVLDGVDVEDVQFLVESSVLEDLNAADCDAILDRSDSARRLESLADADLFVTALDGRGSTSYRIHGLFRSALHQRLRDADADRADELHRRAADQYSRRGEIELSVRHALAANEARTAADLIWCLVPTYLAQARSATLKRWLAWFSPDALDENPCLAVTAGWVALDEGDGDAAAHWTTVALAAPADDLLADGRPIGAAATLLDAALGKRGVRAVRSSVASAVELLGEDSRWRAAADLLGGAAAHVADDVDAARALLQDACARAASQLPAVYTRSLAELALIAIDDRDWDEAESCMARASLAEPDGLRAYATQSTAFAVNALIHAHRGEPLRTADAAGDAKRALDAQRRCPAWLAAEARLVLARAYAELDWPSDARAMLGEARAMLGDDPDAARLHRWIDELGCELEPACGAISGGEALSTAELRTLHCLHTHLTQREIGERLSLSRNTIHTHTNAIYRKLGVKSRSEAVSRGRELGLLAS
jgi:LuxR family maltose regulon positive regulatory protein